jgi:hypothetical protein
MELLPVVGWTAVGLLVVGWLVVSFSAPSRGRTVIEWLAATAMYVALLSLFTHLVLRSQESGNTLGLVDFGFLWIMFAGGLLVALYRTLAAARGAEDNTQSATN